MAKLQAAKTTRLVFFGCFTSEEASGKRNSQGGTGPCSKINTEIENHRNTLAKNVDHLLDEM